MPRRTEIGALRRLFLMLVLRGPTAEGLTPGAPPRSVAGMLTVEGLIYGVCGTTAFYFLWRSNLSLALYLHAATLVLVGGYAFHAAGNMLADRREASVLCFRPVSLRAVIWAKTTVLAEVALVMAGAFNLVGLGMFTVRGRAGLAAAHAVATVINVMFCLGCALLYHEGRVLWRARRWSRGIGVLALAGVAAVVVYGAQVGWLRLGHLLVHGPARFLFPPAWFAGLDEALRGGAGNAWALGAWGAAVTLAVLWLALTVVTVRRRDWSAAFTGSGDGEPRRASRLLAWSRRLQIAGRGLREPGARASFTLTALYLGRSREVRMRLLSGLSPIYAMPVLLLLPNYGRGLFGAFSTTFAGIYLGICAFMAIHLVQISSDWRAAAVFQVAPLAGPGELCAGARRAVMTIFLPPMILSYGAIVWLLSGRASSLILLLPGLMAVPLYAYIPNLQGKGLPFSSAPGSSAGRVFSTAFSQVTLAAVLLTGLATLCYHTVFFWLLLAAEALGSLRMIRQTQRRLRRLTWSELEAREALGL